LDVREAYEYEICHLDNFILIPLSELEERLGELDKSSHIIAPCHHGGRSLKAANS
jgi:rhodanese-related sulfurtransferase